MNELMTKIIEQINLQPATWNQSSWIGFTSSEPECGTTCCVAGWALLLSGKFEQKIWTEVEGDGTVRVVDVQLVWPGERSPYNSNRPRVVSENEYKEIGAELLELTYDQAQNIFMFTGTKDPQVMTNHIKGVLAGTVDHVYEDPCTC